MGLCDRMLSMKKTITLGMLTALALILVYVESLIPLPVGIPGIKLGLANIVILFAIYRYGIKEATLVSVVRIVLSGLMVTGMWSVLYGISGTVCAIAIMSLAKFMLKLSVITVSVLGAMAHISGQMIVAGLSVGFGPVAGYALYLLLASVIFGAIIGMVADILIRRIIDTENV